MESLVKQSKRAQVALTGGAVTAVGLVLIPSPLPCGCVVAAYGISILATEYKGAYTALVVSKKRIEGGLETLAQTLQIKEHEKSSILADNSSEDGSEEEDELPLDQESKCESPIQDEDKYAEFKEIFKTERSAIKRAKKIWDLHTRNMRVVTFHTIDRLLLPAVRNVKISKPGESNDDDDLTEETTGVEVSETSECV